MGRSDGTLVFDTKIITDGFNKGMSAIKTAAKGIGVITAGFTAATGAALKFAGELEQNLGGSEAVFKEFASTVQKTADTAFKNMGLSTSDFLATANKMGALFQGSGFKIQESAELSAEVMQRAADVASIMGIDLSMAMESIAGAAKGNFTMMDNLGVAMNDTTLAAYALEKGITKSTRAMTNQEKIALAMEMFLERTEYAAGNYAKENETLAGALNTASAALKNFLSGTGEADELAESLSNAGKVIVENIGELTPELAEGIGDIFSELAPMVPEMLDDLTAGVMTAIEKLADGISGNSDKLADAVIKLGETLVSGIIRITPKLADAAKKVISSFADGIGEAYPVLKPFTAAVKLLADNMELCIVSFAAFKGLTTIVSVIRAIMASFQTAALQVGLYTLSNNGAAISASALSAALSVKEIIVGVLTGKIHLLTAAQALLNKVWAANPVGVIVGGVVALTAAIVALSNAFSSNKSEAEILTARVKELGAEVDKAKNEFEQLKETQEESISESESHFAYVQKLADELDTLADETGKVADKDKARAKFILTQLNDALGTEYEMTGNQIERYQDLCDEIDELIQKKRAEAMLNYMQPMYEEAIGNLKKQEELVEECTDAYEKAKEEYDKAVETNSSAMGVAGAGVIAASLKVDETKKALDDAVAIREGYLQTVEEFEGKYAAALDGNYEALYDGTWKAYIGVADGINAAAEEVAKANTNFVKTLGQGSPFKKIQSMQQVNGAVSAEYYTAGAENYFNSAEAHSRLGNAQYRLAQTGDSYFKKGYGVNSPSKFAKAASKFYVDGAVLGLKGNADMLYEAAKELGGEANSAFEDSITSNLDGIRTAISSIIGVIKEESEQKLKVFEAEQQKIEMLHDFGIDDEETYYNKLEWLRDNYLTKNSDKWIEVTQELYDYQESQLEDHRDKIEDIYDDIADHVTDKLEDIAKKQQKFSEKLSDSTPLYQKVKITAGDETTEFYRLTDFAEANKAAAEYGELLEQISSRIKSSGVSDEVKDGIISELESLGRDEDGIGYIKALLSANDSEFEKYLSGYATLLGTNNATAANMYYDDAVNAANEGYQYMIDEFTKAGLEIPEGFLLSGELSAENFGRAFMDELDLQMQEIQKRLTDFNAKISASVGSAGNVNNDNRSTTYHIYGAAKDAVKEIENYETVKRLSGQ